MNQDLTYIVVTTIQGPTACMEQLAEKAHALGLRWLIVGDRKGPTGYDLPPAELLSIEEQLELPFQLARHLPEKHYTRKNLGYLVAQSRGCQRIFETDDDNRPMPNWAPRSLEIEAHRVHPKTGADWVNIYGAFTDELVWPRGLPLEVVRAQFDEHFEVSSQPERARAPIQQGLANGSPDVDAVWRLVLDKDITFGDSPNLVLPRGLWSPFNSQNTWWWPEAFPLLYLPSFCSFRMTDIWRSFVAQRCLWELGHELEFHRADMFQDRNEHRLIDDFAQEHAGYLRNDDIRKLLANLDLQEGAEHLHANLADCYRALVRAEIVGEKELTLVDAWLEDCAALSMGSRPDESTLPGNVRSAASFRAEWVKGAPSTRV